MSDGTVEALWRYPVKSMQGEQVEEVALDKHGIAGDRRYALRDPSGKLASGKNSRRFRKVEGLLDLRAFTANGQPFVELPSGEVLRGDDPRLDALLSQALGHEVAVVQSADDPFVDVAPVHVVTTASLERLRRRLPDGGIHPRRFRPNLLVRTDRLESGWIGHRVRLGEDAELMVVDRTERCVMTNLGQPGLEYDPRVLRTIGAEAELCFGVYAEVTRPGRVRRGDPVTIE